MVTTRSKTSQTHIEDFAKDVSKPEKPTSSTKKEQGRPPKTGRPIKRKAPSSPSAKAKQPPSKRKKDAASPSAEPATKQNNHSGSKPIIINRAPVLHLWAACVTHFIYPALPWETCLSAGSAVSTICAVSKGRSIGTIEAPDAAKKEEKKRKKEDAQAKGDLEALEELDVMRFNLNVKDGLALVGSADKKGKPGDEAGLRAKFGEEGYERARKCFGESLEAWKGKEEELNGKAFGMYEAFRPSVSAGQKGWGRKGELELGTVESIIRRS